MSTTTELTTVTEAGVYHGMSDAIYHADPVPGGSLSSTGARRILDSPARFKWEQAHRTTSTAFSIGHAVHAKVLGIGMGIVEIHAETWRTKAAQEARALAHAAGMIPILSADLAPIEAMVEAVLAHGAARKILERDGDAEVSAFAQDPETGVWARARFDRLSPGVAADVKTTAGSASQSGFGVSAAKYGYPVQEAHYTDTLEWITGERPPMQFIVVEKAAPHLVAVHQFDELTRMVARDYAAKARRIYAECVESGEWPGYSDDVITTQIPAWWYADDDEDEMVI